MLSKPVLKSNPAIHFPSVLTGPTAICTARLLKAKETHQPVREIVRFA